MKFRPNSIEVAAAALSQADQVVLLIETCNAGNSRRYEVMAAFCDDLVAELRYRDLATESFSSMSEARAVIEKTEALFDEHEGTCFATRISTFEKGHLIDIVVFGQDMFSPFDS